MLFLSIAATNEMDNVISRNSNLQRPGKKTSSVYSFLARNIMSFGGECDIVQLLGQSTDKKHTLLTWATSTFERLGNPQSDLPPTTVHEQLNRLVTHLAGMDAEESDAEVLSHRIDLQLSHLYNLCLCKLEAESPGKIYDSAALLANVLCEEDIPSSGQEGNSQNQSQSKSKSKSKNRKKNYKFSPVKELSATVLLETFECFGAGLTSLVPLLFGGIFKNLKKMMEKSKYFHATFATLLMQLFNAVARSCGDSIVDENAMAKLNKMCKQLVQELSSGDQGYPAGFLCALIDASGAHFRREPFVRAHAHELLDALDAKLYRNGIAHYGFTHDETRTHTAKTLAEILFHYCSAKQLVSLDQVWAFYAQMFVECSTRDVKSGCFESIVHFITLNVCTDRSFLGGCRYLDITTGLATRIFGDPRVQEEKLDSVSRYLRYFEHMHQLLLPQVGDAAKSLMLMNIFNSSSSSSDTDAELLRDSKDEAPYTTIACLGLAKLLLAALSSSLAVDERFVQRVRAKLVQLSVSESFQIRVHANELLKLFLQAFPEHMTRVIEDSLEALSSDFNLTEAFPFARNHGHALTIASLVDVADKDYVSYELVMKVMVFATSFLKNNSTATRSNTYYKELVAWILLTGLMNYDDEQFLQMHTSQLFLFWKNILTHTFSYADDDELYKNLEIRHHALTCLLTYLGSAATGRDVAKQVSYLLTKCSNFNHSIRTKSRTIDNAILQNENRILQIYLRIHDHVKNDFNSAVLILIVKNFADPNLYAESPRHVLDSIRAMGEKRASSGDAIKEETVQDLSMDSLLRHKDGFAYGLSSKVNGFRVEELSVKPAAAARIETGRPEKWLQADHYWHSVFENELTRPITSVLSYDYFITLYGRGSYSTLERYSPRVTTSIINSSVEIFSVVFPFLNSKIQHSVLENLNSFIFSRTATPLRTTAIAVNACVAIHGALSIMQDSGLRLETSVASLLIDTLKRVDLNDDECLAKLNSDSIGLLAAAATRHEREAGPVGAGEGFARGSFGVLVKNIVDIEDPYSRVFSALSLAAIYRYNPQDVSFAEALGVLETMIMDPHAVVHTWCLEALSILLENHLVIDVATASQLLRTMERVLADDAYGCYGPSTWRHNYNHRFDSHLVLGRILKILTETVGPNIMELDAGALESYRNVLVGLLTSRAVAAQLYALEVYEDLATFKMDTLFGDFLPIPVAKGLVAQTVVPGIGSAYNSHFFTKTSELVPLSASWKGREQSLRFFSQLLKLNRKGPFTKDIEYLVWVCLALHPTSRTVRAYIDEWLARTYDQDPTWFDKLFQLFNVSRDKLFSKFFSSANNWLSRRGTQRGVVGDEIHDEEEASMSQADREGGSLGGTGATAAGTATATKATAAAAATTTATTTSTLTTTATMAATTAADDNASSDTMSWIFKEAILQLVQQLFLFSETSDRVFNVLRHRLPSLITVSFNASTAKIQSMKNTGIGILGLVIAKYASERDSESPEFSILEQQEARITSALMPAFDRGSSPAVVASAIQVVAEFVAADIVPLDRLGRVSKLLVGALGEFADKAGYISIGQTTIPTKKSRRKIELAVLSAWAQLKIKATSTKNAQLQRFTDQHLETLVPLWIISLREFAMVKYSDADPTLGSVDGAASEKLVETKRTKLELFEPVWLNFVDAIGCVVEENHDLLDKCLKKDDLQSFMFVLYAECMEALVKNQDEEDDAPKLRILEALHKVLQCDVPSETFFQDGVHTETVDILDRLVLTGTTEDKSATVDIVHDLVVGYAKQNAETDEFLNGIDKVYDLLRVSVTVISGLIPFIKDNLTREAAGEDGNKGEGLLLGDAELVLLRKTFNSMARVVCALPDLLKLDLYACLLYVVGRVFESTQPDLLVPMVLPLLKSVLSDLITKMNDPTLAVILFESIKPVVFGKLGKENALATCLVFITNDYASFSQSDVEECVALLVGGLAQKSTMALATQGFKSLILSFPESKTSKLVLRRAIPKLLAAVSNAEEAQKLEDPRLVGEIIFLFTKRSATEDSAKTVSAFTICTTFLLWFCDAFPENGGYANDKIIELIGLDAEAFKKVVNEVLTPAQKRQIEDLARANADSSGLQGPNSSGQHVQHVQLKSFE